MSGKKAKQERRQLRESGIMATSTRAGRKRLRQLELLEAAEEQAKRMQAEMVRWDALTEEEKQSERAVEEEKLRQSA